FKVVLAGGYFSFRVNFTGKGSLKGDPFRLWLSRPLGPSADWVRKPHRGAVRDRGRGRRARASTASPTLTPCTPASTITRSSSTPSICWRVTVTICEAFPYRCARPTSRGGPMASSSRRSKRARSVPSCSKPGGAAHQERRPEDRRRDRAQGIVLPGPPDCDQRR